MKASEEKPHVSTGLPRELFVVQFAV